VSSDEGPLVRQYRLIRQLGRGVNSTVYLAWNTNLEKRVVLKRLERFEGDDPAVAARFEQEGRLAASFDHPNIVTIHDYFVERDAAWLVMEYFRLGDARRLLGRLTVPEILVMLQETLWGLSAIETSGVVHRDLKPENLLRSDRGSVKIADFGISRRVFDPTRPQMTAVGRAVGSRPYIAPEVAVGEEATPRSDLYAVGTIAFEFLSGRRPFTGARSEEEELVWKVSRRPPQLAERAPDLDARLCEWVDGLLKRAPEKRYAEASVAIHGLEDAATAALGAEWSRGVRLPVNEGPTEQPPAPPPPPVEQGWAGIHELQSEASMRRLLLHAATNPWAIGIGAALVAAGIWRDRGWAIAAGVVVYLALATGTFFDLGEARKARSGRRTIAQL
jgi:serine/threonine-protein kinase